MNPHKGWVDPGDGTLVPVTVLRRSVFPGSWYVRYDSDGYHTVTSRVVCDCHGGKLNDCPKEKS